MSFEKELHVAQVAARRAAANALLIQAGAGFCAESKADLSPVTQADKEGEKIIAGLLHDTFPDDGILGEEGSATESKSGRKWIIDPIDGTRDFVRGNHLWCVLIGLEGEDRETKAGIAYFPILDQMWIAARGLGAYRNHTRVRCSNKSSVSDSVLMVNIGNKIAHRPDSAKWVHFLSKFWAFRSLGGAQDAMFVAGGQGDVWIEPKAEPWDFAAIQVITEEAGATYTTLKGTRSIYDGSAVVYTPGLDAEVRGFLATL